MMFVLIGVVLSADSAGVARAQPGDEVVFDSLQWRSDGWLRKSVERGELRLRRVECDLRFCFEAKVRLTGEVHDDGDVVRWGPVEETRLFGYGGNVPLGLMVATLFGDSENRDAEHFPVEVCRIGGLAVPCEETIEADGTWRRHVALDAQEVALSGGLLDSLYGDPEQSELGTHLGLVSAGRGSTTSALSRVKELDDVRDTPFVNVLGMARVLARQQRDGAQRTLERARESLERALKGCSPVTHAWRIKSQTVTARLERGVVRALEKAGEDADVPSGETVACLRAAARKLRLGQVEAVKLQWPHENEKPDWEQQAEELNALQLSGYTRLCLALAGVWVDEGGHEQTVVVVGREQQVTSMSLGGRCAPKAVLECMSERVRLHPLPSEAMTRVELVLPLR
ncbi:MAG: hypothetical protein JNK82_44590 [Myxococcaceae bacterium]|nr:hypothetical protein [Myxococcaceae bacterium]